MTGTETALLAAVAAKGRTEIRHAAMEPHVVELCRFLRAMGASIEGEGTTTIRVEGPARFCTAPTHRLDGDYIEAGSWGVVAAITGGDIEVTGARARDMEVVSAPLRKMGLSAACEDDRFSLESSPLVGGAADHDRTVAGVSERHDQPGHGARDAG